MLNAIMCLVIFGVAFGVSFIVIVSCHPALKKERWEALLAKCDELNESLNEINKKLNK